MMLRTEFDYSFDDYYEANQALGKARRNGSVFRVVLWTLIGIGVLCMALLTLVSFLGRSANKPTLRETVLRLAYSPAGVWLGLFMLIFAVIMLSRRRMVKVFWDGQPLLQQHFIFEADGESFTISSPLSVSRYLWAAVQKHIETKNLFLLCHSTLSFTMVPKRALGPAAAINEFRKMIETNIGNIRVNAFPVTVATTQND
jgi:hypothetical protein